MNHPDLFGGETRIVGGGAGGPYARSKLAYAYRPKDEPGKNCGTCDHSFMRGKYRKCELIGCSASTASDVSRNCVCKHWTAARGEPSATTS
jgi:hypothetical protein